MRSVGGTRWLLMIAGLLVVAGGWAAAENVWETHLSGRWQGQIRLPGQELTVVVSLAQEGDAWRGTAGIPQQGATGLPLGSVRLFHDTVRFTISGVPGEPTFTGRLGGDGKGIEGTFTQAGITAPFSLQKVEGEAAGLRRPQEPSPPYPYDSEEVTYDGAGGARLAGTLTVPPGTGPHPAVLLLSGSGAQNRDAEGFGHRPFLVLADRLTRAGVAVLRSDDRGVGGSTGSVVRATLDDLAADALAGVSLLRRHPRIAGERIGLIGHSEGGMVASLAAAESDRIAVLVLLASPGLTGREIFRQQNRIMLEVHGLAAEEVTTELALLDTVLTKAATGSSEEELREALTALVDLQLTRLAEGSRPDRQRLVGAQVAAMRTPWFRSFLALDPRPVLEQVRVPVLALGGELDTQVLSEQNLAAIEMALTAGGNRQVLVRQLPGLNHLLQTATTGLVAEYGTTQETISPIVLELVASWLRDRLSGMTTRQGAITESSQPVAPRQR